MVIRTTRLASAVVALTSMMFSSCINTPDRNAPPVVNPSVYRPDSSYVTKQIQASIDTIKWIEVRYVDLGLSVHVPSYWKKRSSKFPIVSAYSDTSEAFLFKPTYSLKIFDQVQALSHYRDEKLRLHPDYGTLVEDNPNPFFWTDNVYLSFILNPSSETRDMTLASWSFAFKRNNNLVELNLVTDTMRVADMDLLFKHMIN